MTGGNEVSEGSGIALLEAGRYVYWFSGAGFFALVPFIAGCVLSCLVKRKAVSMTTAIYGLLAFITLVILIIVANGNVYNDEGEVIQNSYLVISALQTNLIQAVVPVGLLVTGAFVVFAKTKNNSVAVKNKEDESSEAKEANV